MSAKFRNLCIFLCLASLLLMWGNLETGFIHLNFGDFIHSNSENAPIAQLRINRIWIIFLAGISIPTSGFLLQEYFQNPLAGPEVLGIISAAALAVAIYIFLSKDWDFSEFSQSGFISIAAFLGSFLLMLLLLAYSKFFSDKTYLIIFGFLISAMAGALVSIMQFYAQNETLKSYIMWSFGANNQVSRNQLWIATPIILLGLFLSFKTIKPLMGNALGKDYAHSFGINLNVLKFLVILASSLLTSSITAFLGPILFIGIIVPHFCRMLWNPAQIWQQWILNMLFGVGLMQAFSVISEITYWPLNIISSLFGIPVILTMIIKMNRRAA